MIASLVLVAAMATSSAPTTDAILDDRMGAARVGAAIAFVVLVGGLAYGARRLSHHAKTAEESERLESAFREIEETLEKRE